MKRAPLTTVVRRAWTRRDLLKLAPAGALGVAATGAWLARSDASGVELTHGTCRFCLMRCGITCKVDGGRLVKVEGDLTSKTRGFVCEHGYALRELVHSRDRVQHPLVRRGDAFHEASWEDALAEIAGRLAAVKARYGARALLLQTGWPFVRHPLIQFFHRFVRAFGSPNVATVSSLCEASLRMGQALTVGSKYAPDFLRAKTLVVWGANPPVTAPPFAHLVAQVAARGKLIVIDPVRTGLAKEATMHLRVRPGTDGALALGLIHRVLQLRVPDASRLHGLPELTALAAQWPMDRVSEVTSVDVKALERLAQLLATQGPVGIWQGLGVEHHAGGVQTVRAIASLEALCGRFDGDFDRRALVSPPGERFHDEPLPALYRMRTPEPPPPPIDEAPLGRDAYPLFERYNREAHGEALIRAVLDDDPYPVRAVILWASNALVTASSTTRLEHAAEKLDLLVTVDPFFSESAQRSDVVLPACTFAESPDVDADEAAVAERSLVPPQGASLPDFVILTRLARACGLGAWFPWERFFDAMRAPRVPWMEDAALQPHPRPDAARDFGTPTGRVELKSTVLEAAGLDPLPTWHPPTPTTPDYPLRLVTGPRPRARINSQFSQSPSIRARLREPELLVHPSLGVADGARVRVVSPHGQLELRAAVTDDVHPECVVMPAGWAQANPNRLIAPDEKDPISGFPAFRSGICRVEPA